MSGSKSCDKCCSILVGSMIHTSITFGHNGVFSIVVVIK